ncbi:MAG: hypothetical protein P1P89_12885 [Desulfobacterales bacterium]|nr:hypothetical protein [Desulfobacterales bacterium]
MDKKYSDSLFPIGIGASFVWTLVIMLIAGAMAGFPLGDKHNFKQLGGVPLLIIFLVLLVGPILYNRKISRFQKDKWVLGQFDGIGMIQGLRGAFFRLFVYEDGMEISGLKYDRFNRQNLFSRTVRTRSEECLQAGIV